MAFQKNDVVKVKIEDMGSEGEGIGKADGFTLFVKDAVVGDVVEAKLVKVKKNYAYARLEKVLSSSPFRAEPACPVYRQCGGCQLQALAYEKQLEFKQNKIRNNLIRIGGFQAAELDEKLEPIVGMEEPWRYRNKAQYPIGLDRAGNIIAGFYAGRTHSIIANTDCALGAAENREILELILKYMRENGVTAYDEAAGRGLVRHVLIRKGFTSGEIMVCLVINKNMTDLSHNVSDEGPCEKIREKRLKNQGESIKEAMESALSEESKAGRPRDHGGNLLPRQEELLRSLASVKGMTSVSVSINTEKTNVIMGREVHTLWGKDSISDTIHVRDMDKPGHPCTERELVFSISPLSFYQVNPVQTEKLYSLALEYAGLTGQETVWDLYCGIGTISLFLAGSAKKVYGVEVVPQAIRDAKENAARNGIHNAEFFVGKAEEVLPVFYERQQADIGQKEDIGTDEGSRAASKAGGIAGDKEADSKTSVVIGRNEAEEAAAMLRPDVIVVDPPRKGCDTACLDTMLKMSPQRIVYVSCDSATLARDLKVLCEGGYELKRVRGVDQFGMTVHVETVCLLGRRKPDDTIKVSVNMDDYYQIRDAEEAEKNPS